MSSFSFRQRRASLNVTNMTAKENAKFTANSNDPTQYQRLSLVKTINNAKAPVYLASSDVDHQMYAMKTFPYKDGKPDPHYKNEVRFSCLKHPSIVNIVHNEDQKEIIYKDETKKISYILMEYAPHGDFFEFVTKIRDNADEKLVRTYFRQLIEGIEFLHMNKVAHLDLKPENLLLSTDFNLKITDFDMSYVRGDRKVLSRGTKFYRGPEFYECSKEENSLKTPFAADIYSAGMILFILRSGGMYPHAENNTVEGLDLAKQMNDDPVNFWKNHCEIQGRRSSFYDENFKQLFNAMVKTDPADRLSISEIRKSKWYKGPVYNSSELQRNVKNILCRK